MHLLNPETFGVNVSETPERAIAYDVSLPTVICMMIMYERDWCCRYVGEELNEMFLSPH